ncbi:hypothetical protein FPZ47_15110 [Mycobacterium helveticum]|uniref:Uncharacterized protein n=1 Tax=Mycobacterium helveticum TaxID=2592811 RepID=A0A557XPN0_9MYCO|nr:hypothetical protein FPZ46_16485 [Mycobacterium helveticum]TVS87857.1 hypothetical protein FPZ47_15110 [Mycobacterium helveticum]
MHGVVPTRDTLPAAPQRGIRSRQAAAEPLSRTAILPRGFRRPSAARVHLPTASLDKCVASCTFAVRYGVPRRAIDGTRLTSRSASTSCRWLPLDSLRPDTPHDFRRMFSTDAGAMRSLEGGRGFVFGRSLFASP